MGHPVPPSGINGESGKAPGAISALANCLSEYADGDVTRTLHENEYELNRLGGDGVLHLVKLRHR